MIAARPLATAIPRPIGWGCTGAQRTAQGRAGLHEGSSDAEHAGEEEESARHLCSARSTPVGDVARALGWRCAGPRARGRREPLLSSARRSQQRDWRATKGLFIFRNGTIDTGGLRSSDRLRLLQVVSLAAHERAAVATRRLAVLARSRLSPESYVPQRRRPGLQARQRPAGLRRFASTITLPRRAPADQPAAHPSV